MTESTTGPTQDHPDDAGLLTQRVRPGKLALFEMTVVLGLVLALLASLIVALSRVLVELVGLEDGWASQFLEFGLMLFLTVQIIAMVLLLGKRLDRLLDRLTPTQQPLSNGARARTMGDEAYWVIGVGGFILGSSTVIALVMLSKWNVLEGQHMLIQIITHLPGLFLISFLFVITKVKSGLDADQEPGSEV